VEARSRNTLVLTIRREQLSVFTDDLIEQWIQRTLYLIRKHWPILYARTGEDAMRARAREAVFAARSEGITASGDALNYLNLTLLLGDKFTTNGQHPWATRIAQNRSLAGTVKIALLMDIVRSMTGSD
jgi:hypothetical protein